MIISLLSVIILVLSIVLFKNHERLQDEKQSMYERFLNHLYFSINDSINSFTYLIDNKPKGVELNEGIHQVQLQLVKTNMVLNDAHDFMNSEIYPAQFFRDAPDFLYGMKGTVSNSNSKDEYFYEVQPLAQDGHLDEKEIHLLMTLKNYMVNAKEEMYSKKTHQENPNLTITQLNNILLKYLNKYPNEIYNDAFK